MNRGRRRVPTMQQSTAHFRHHVSHERLESAVTGEAPRLHFRPASAAMSSPVQYQVWQHVRSKELWAVRVEHDVLTGVFGPLVERPRRAEDLADLMYEEHPDDLEWIVRASDYFLAVDLSPLPWEPGA